MIMRAIGAPLTRVIAALEGRRHDAVLRHVHGRLLDIGCGENRLVRRYGAGVGVDVYDWGGVDLVVADTAHLPFPDSSFDTISFVASLNHIPNRDQVLREAHRLLRHDGRLIITMIPPGLSRLWHRLVAPWDPDQAQRGMRAGEVWGLTTGQVRDLLRAAGFMLARHQTFVFGLNHLYVAHKAGAPGTDRRTAEIVAEASRGD